MRVTDDRYNRERLRLETALRLIGHEARTQTIRRWTGLSDDRIRKLVRSYIRPGAGVRRHRGKSPQQVRFFLRGGSDDAHALAAMLLLFGVLPPRPAAARTSDGAPSPLPSLARGRQLCEAYEIYRRVVPQARIDFEHPCSSPSRCMLPMRSACSGATPAMPRTSPNTAQCASRPAEPAAQHCGTLL